MLQLYHCEGLGKEYEIIALPGSAINIIYVHVKKLLKFLKLLLKMNNSPKLCSSTKNTRLTKYVYYN